METQVDRRSLLKLGALAMAGSAIPLAGVPRAGTVPAQATLSLPHVNVDPNRVIRKVAGLRPFRPSGFVVRADALGDKTLIHNYGHGGCGVTLSWGTADMAANLALQTTKRQAAILGCGAVGLATARLLQDRGFQVNIYAKDLPPETTSNVAAAMFGPTSIVSDDQHGPEVTTRLQQAVRYAHRYFQNFVGDRYGVHWNPMFQLGDQPQEQPWEFSITPELFPYTHYGPGQHPFPYKYASSFNTMMIETINYLPQVLSDFLMRGGKLVVKQFDSLAEVSALAEPLVVNCTGLGAKALFGDNELVPVKGQLVILLPQPEITHAYLDGPKDLYMFARHDAIILGGSHEEGNSDPTPDDKHTSAILAGHKQIADGMK